MPTNTKVVITRSARKRKLEQNAKNRHVKKARIEVMKEIALKFNRNKCNTNKNSYYDFNVFYNEQKKYFHG